MCMSRISLNILPCFVILWSNSIAKIAGLNLVGKNKSHNHIQYITTTTYCLNLYTGIRRKRMGQTTFPCDFKYNRTKILCSPALNSDIYILWAHHSAPTLLLPWQWPLPPLTCPQRKSFLFPLPPSLWLVIDCGFW